MIDRVRGSSGSFNMSSLRKMSFPSTSISSGLAGAVPTAMRTLSTVTGSWLLPSTEARSNVCASMNEAWAVITFTLFRSSWWRSVSVFCCIT